MGSNLFVMNHAWNELTRNLGICNSININKQAYLDSGCMLYFFTSAEVRTDVKKKNNHRPLWINWKVGFDFIKNDIHINQYHLWMRRLSVWISKERNQQLQGCWQEGAPSNKVGFLSQTTHTHFSTALYLPVLLLVAMKHKWSWKLLCLHNQLLVGTVALIMCYGCTVVPSLETLFPTFWTHFLR